MRTDDVDSIRLSLFSPIGQEWPVVVFEPRQMVLSQSRRGAPVVDEVLRQMRRMAGMTPIGDLVTEPPHVPGWCVVGSELYAPDPVGLAATGLRQVAGWNELAAAAGGRCRVYLASGVLLRGLPFERLAAGLAQACRDSKVVGVTADVILEPAP